MNDEIFLRAFVRRNRAAGSHAFVHPEGEFVVYEGVFSPTVFNDTFFYAEALPVPVGGSVLEVGCGTGFIALAVAKKGAGSVLATDINLSAVANCKANSEKHNLSDVVTARISDVFSAVTAEERFDLIFWNWPYFAAQRNEDDPLECSVFDPTYESIGRYLRDARAHRSPQGRVMLSFSRETGNLSLLEQRAREAGASLSAFRTSDKLGGGWVLEILEATYDLLRHLVACQHALVQWIRRSRHIPVCRTEGMRWWLNGGSCRSICPGDMVSGLCGARRPLEPSPPMRTGRSDSTLVASAVERK
jgi:release factor glutamine methyltransferase